MGTTGLVHLHDFLVPLEVYFHQVAVLVKAEGFKGPHNVLASNGFPLLLLTPVTSPKKMEGRYYRVNDTRW